ncbi:hypothetical protein [Nostocoides vanveenii]|uniref:hypothetical protein n=1 Tax=Nostocoides vanveenii TaxID=330835 RepID=UPI0031E0F178
MRPATRRAAALLGLLLAVLCLIPARMAAAPLAANVRSDATPARMAAPSLPSAPAPAVTPVVARTILIGTGGFTWSDVSAERTPALWALLRDGASGVSSIRSVNPNTCPIDGWLALSAGERAAAAGADGKATRASTATCPPIPDPDVVDLHDGPAVALVPGWAAYVTTADSLRFGAQPSLLGTLLAGRVTTLAIGPGAAIALATADGTATAYTPVDWSSVTSDALATQIGDTRLTVIDAGTATEVGADPEEARAPADQVAAIDDRIARVVGALRPTDTVIVAGLADGGSVPHVRPVVVRGPEFGAGGLYSPSTRIPDLIQSADLTVTLLAQMHVAVPADLGGAILRQERSGPADNAGAAARRTHLVDIDQASHEVRLLVPPFFAGLVLSQLVFYLLVWRVWKHKGARLATRARLIRAVQIIAVAAAAVPAATFLANLLPWWRASATLPAIVGAVGLFVALIAAAALIPPWGRRLMGPVGVVALATVAVLAADVITGSRLQISSLMGLQPTVGGRFYGMGNVTFSIFVTASLMLAIAVSAWLLRIRGRLAAVAAVIAIALVTVIVDGNPAWGADGGGPPAYLPGVAYFALALLGIAMTWKRAVLIGGITAGLFVLVGFLDSRRAPESQSHLGRFFDEIGSGQALNIVIRKAEQNFGILISSELSILVPFALVFVIYVLLRPTSWGSRALHRSFERVPTLRPGLIGWLIVMVIGFFINDSGVAIPAVGAAVAIPLVIAIATRTLLEEIDDGRHA